MKSLTQYLTESTFSKADWSKHQYALNVVTDLISGQAIPCGQHGGEDPLCLSTLKISDDEKQKLLDELGEIKTELKRGATNDLLNRFNNAFKDAGVRPNNMWNQIYKGVYSGMAFKVQTKDQETATCVIFNRIVQATHDNPRFVPDDMWLNAQLNSFTSIKITKEWMRSIGEVCKVLINHLKRCGANVTEFRMERAGGYQNDQEVALAMSNLIQHAASTIKVRKDTIDPSDVFIYHEKSKSQILGIINDLDRKISGGGEKYVDGGLKQDIVEAFYKARTPIFGGISLKFVSRPHLEVCNVDKDSVIVRVDHMDEPMISTKIKNGETGKTLSIRMSGQFGKHCTNAGLEYRTQGKGTMRASIVLYDANGKRYAAQAGDCPIGYFQSIMGVSNKVTDMEDAFDRIREFVAANRLDDMTNIVKAGMKVADYNLPYIIIH